MGREENIKAIEAMYEAFGRGDLPSILEAVTDDVDWGVETSTDLAPWYGPRKGRPGVQSFFEAFGSAMEIEHFEPYSLAANEDSVFSVVHCRAKSRATGRSVQMDLHHYFRFRDGRVAYYRGTEDTAQVQAALA